MRKMEASDSHFRCLLLFIDFDFTVESLMDKFSSLNKASLQIRVYFPAFLSHTYKQTNNEYPGSMINRSFARLWSLIFKKELQTLLRIALCFSFDYSLIAFFISLQICDNRTASIGSAQNHRVTATFICRSHQSISVSDSSRSQIFAFSSNSPPRHQTGKSVGEQQLRSEDLWFRVGACWRTGSVETHDSGSGYTILPCPGNPDGRQALFSCCRRLVCWMHFWWTLGSSNLVPSTKSRSTGH